MQNYTILYTNNIPNKTSNSVKQHCVVQTIILSLPTLMLSWAVTIKNETILPALGTGNKKA